jgi:hypothetical protein|tara:strand:+ start:39641 stop:40567 length:927 start_codon:yes stop_codon:yes gene_type:complete
MHIIIEGNNMSKIKIIDQDIIFLSYDEPNAEQNYTDLLTKVPWAKRVHGVEGSDAAHKACAELSETKHFVTVDGDTQMHPDFLKQELDLDKLGVDDDYQFSWCGNIDVNGLKYGNGSLKMWTKDFVKNMKTHENTDGEDRHQIEFCYFDNYYQLNENFSTSIISSTPQQAWRAGFREGVKMSLDQGKKVDDLRTNWWQNYHRLLIWMSVGADIENGKWSIFGARQGTYMTMCTDWDHVQTRDFTYLNNFWKENEQTISLAGLEDSIEELGEKLVNELGIEIPVKSLNSDQSKFFKTVYANTPRVIRNK